MGLVVLPVAAARAHQDPPACTGINVASGLTVTRFDGSSDTSEGVTDCETVKVMTDLSWVSNCLISGGTFKLTVADPNDINNPAAEQELASMPVGCLGNATQNADGCSIGQGNTVDLGTVTFTVRPQDAAAGFVVFRARWVNGILHQTPSNVTGQENLRSVTVPVVNCENGNFCDGIATCDPDLESEGRKGLCVPPDNPDPCPDNLFCADVTCNEETDSCDTTDHSATTCPDNLFCADVTCNETTDTCDTTDHAATTCPDDLFCADVTCNEGTDTCDTTDHGATTCPDNLFCADVTCNEGSDSCDTTDHSATTCPDNLFCADVACSEETDSCQTTDHSTTTCPDNLFCSDITCDEATDSCDTTTHASDVCPDNLFCADVTCDEETKSCDTTDHSATTCPDNFFCSDVACSEATDSCVTTDHGAQTCPGGNECSDVTCNEATDTCDTTNTGASCDDGNLCTLEHCDPEIGCVSDGMVQCNSTDPCRPETCDPETGQCVDGDGTDTVFLVKTQGRFGNGADIRAGIGANDGGGLLRLGRYVIVADNSPVSGDTVSLGNEANVDDVFANKLLTGQGVKIRGVKGTPVLPLTAPYCPIPTITCGSTPVILGSGDSKSLTPGDYGDLLMQNGASLTLAPGTYSFCSIRTGRNVTVQLTGAPKSTINVLGKIRYANGSTFGPVSGTPTPMLNVAGTSFRIGAGATVRALISAPNALLSMGRGSHVLGTFCVLRSRTDKNIILECPPDGALPSPSGAFLE